MSSTVVSLVQAIASGILVGGVYGLFSIGFSLAFGVMRIVNFAHGELVMLGMYAAYSVYLLTGADPLFAIPIVGLFLAAVGVFLYLVVYERFVGKATLQQLLVAIAISMVIQIVLQMIYGPETRGVQSVLGSQYLIVGPYFFSYGQIAAFVVAVICVGILELLLQRTRWGKLIRAVADDPEAAEIVGANSRAINTIAFALSCCLAGVAGCVLIIYYPVSPSTGMALMPIALIATVIGGLGSIKGAFLGGIICAVVQQLTGTFWSPALQDVPLYVLLLAFLALFPFGLLGRKTAH